MGKMATVRNTLKTFIPTVTGFSTKTEIYNPYDEIEENPDSNIRNGWGLKIDAASDTILNAVNTYGQARSFTIVLSRELIRQTDDRGPIDTAENLMLTDLDNLMDAFLDGSQLGIPETVAKIDYSGDTGIQYISTKTKFKLLTLEVTFLIDIFEDLC